MKILLAVDGSPYTQKMLDYVTTHAPLFGPGHDYTAFSAQPALPPQVRAAVGPEESERYGAEEAEAVLAPVCTFLARHGIKPARCWRLGPVGRTLAEFAEAGAFDLLVMGSHGHGALGNLVMGSVTTEVLARCRVPVLLIR